MGQLFDFRHLEAVRLKGADLKTLSQRWGQMNMGLAQRMPSSSTNWFNSRLKMRIRYISALQSTSVLC